MSEIPAEAVRAAAAAIERELMSRSFDPFFKGDEALARVAVEAAAPFLAEQARQEERSKIAADLHAESERERERLREWLGLGPDDNPCHHSAAINNAITVWAFAARHVAGPQPQAPVIIRNQPCTTCPKEPS